MIKLLKKLFDIDRRRVLEADRNDQIIQLRNELSEEFPIDTHITYCDIIFRVCGYIVFEDNTVSVRLAYNVDGELRFKNSNIETIRIMRDSIDNKE